MNRRDFLTRIAMPAAAALVVPARTIFLPPQGGWPVDAARYLTSKDAWFLKTDDRMVRFLRTNEGAMEGDFTTDSLRYKATEVLSKTTSLRYEATEVLSETTLLELLR